MNSLKIEKKPMTKMLRYVALLFGSIFLFQWGKSLFIQHMLRSRAAPAATVSAMRVEYQWWQPQLTSVGTLRAIAGVEVTTELAGLVRSIPLIPGTSVKQGSVLVQLNADSDIALLQSLKAQAHAAKTIYLRDSAQWKAHAISQATLDADHDQMLNLDAQVAQQAATVAKKTITAPFEGVLGISAVNLGQYLNPGDKIVMLEALDPIYVDFYVPQKEIPRLKKGLKVSLSLDAYPGKQFIGKITSMDPGIDPETRNVQIEATIANPTLELHPGMFAQVIVDVDKPQRYLTLPQSAISFNPYGQLVYIIKENKSGDKKSKPSLIAVQSFVTTGATRADQIVILSGLQAGEYVVTSGQIKLHNHMPVVINNSVVPNNNAVSHSNDE